MIEKEARKIENSNNVGINWTRDNYGENEIVKNRIQVGR